MTEEKQTKASEMSLEKAVKLVVEGVKASHQITEAAFEDRLIKPYKLEGKAVDQLVQEFEDNGISIVDEDGKPSKLALTKQKNVEKAELNNMDAPTGMKMNDPVRMYLKEIGRVNLLKKSPWPSGLRPAMKRPSRNWLKPTCVWLSRLPSAMSAGG